MQFEKHKMTCPQVGGNMPHAEIKAELHWHDIEVADGRLCAGCKMEVDSQCVMVSMIAPGLNPVRPKTFCNGCFETMLGYWERNQIIKAVDVASSAQSEET